MRLKYYNVGIKDGKFTADALGEFTIISYIEKSMDMSFTGGSMQPSTAQITTTQKIKTNVSIEIEGQWYSVLHGSKGALGLRKYYLKEQTSPEVFSE